MHSNSKRNIFSLFFLFYLSPTFRPETRIQIYFNLNGSTQQYANNQKRNAMKRAKATINKKLLLLIPTNEQEKNKCFKQNFSVIFGLD